jgi:enoyl-CoA hydratase
MTEVALDLQEGVAILTVDRPAVRNAISLATMDALEQALDAAADADVLVIRGSGNRAFISGGDLKELAKIRTHEAAVAMALRMRRLCDRIATFPGPVIAALNGHALGVAADDIRIGFTQASLAIMPAWGGAERLAALVGRAQALLLTTTGEKIGTDEAHRIGLIDRVYPRATFEESWRALARQIAASPARPIKSVIASAAPHHHPAHERSATTAFSALWTSDAHWAAVADLTGGS